ncbi:MAG: response regulator transcription factor [Pirellulales bacterium]|nr:response regulator transcription factor [Pirellulales bacterium]
MGNGKHILVVEDEKHLAAGIQYNLEAEGYRVATVGDGRSALEYIEEHRGEVDLVVLDIMLPGMSGYAVCEALRAADEIMPVLILSARTLSEDRKRGFDVGADQYLTKPFDLDEFLSRVKGLLAMYARRVQGPANQQHSPIPSFAFSNVEIHFDTFEVTVGGDLVRMTQLEMKLLRYFVENEGRIVTRRELLENVWDLPGHLSTRAPDQFILRLRKVIEPDPARPRHLLTLRDAGYRFVAEPDAR